MIIREAGNPVIKVEGIPFYSNPNCHLSTTNGINQFKTEGYGIPK